MSYLEKKRDIKIQRRVDIKNVTQKLKLICALSAFHDFLYKITLSNEYKTHLKLNAKGSCPSSERETKFCYYFHKMWN